MTDVKRIRALKTAKPFGAVDVALIILLIAGAAGLALYSVFGAPRGNVVEITCGGTTASYPLDVDRTIALDELTVVISGGEVRVENSRCADKICERTGAIRRVNESIVCLPAGVIVRIRGNGGFQLDTGGDR